MDVGEKFNEFLTGLSEAEQEALAKGAETSVAYLKQIASGHRRAGASLIFRLKRADGRITDEMLRPDLCMRVA